MQSHITLFANLVTRHTDDRDALQAEVAGFTVFMASVPEVQADSCLERDPAVHASVVIVHGILPFAIGYSISQSSVNSAAALLSATLRCSFAFAVPS
jgi:hypothetical protein